MPLQFIPARSSRHRTACFALYRALIRHGQRVPLPDELSTSSPLGPTHPIKTLIRNGFRRNQRDTSPRLVVSALKNGYRYLALLSRAADRTAPEHASVLSFLRENQARVVAVKARAAAAAAARISTAPIPGRTPLITRVSPDGEPPVYAPAAPPRPLASFRSGVRKPPTLGATSGVPFLRLKKPQPRFLERVIRQRAQRRARRIEKMLFLQEDGMHEAALEDEWEREVERLLAAAGRRKGRDRGSEDAGRGKDKDKTASNKGAQWLGEDWGGPGGAREPTFRQTLAEVVQHLSDVTNREHADLVARGRAMWQVVLAEREMALKEEKERLVREGRPDEEPKLRVWSRPIQRRRRKPKTEDGTPRAENGTLQAEDNRTPQVQGQSSTTS